MFKLEERLNHLKDSIGDGFVSENIRYKFDSTSCLIIDDHFKWAYIVYDKGVFGPDYEHEEVDYIEARDKYFRNA